VIHGQRRRFFGAGAGMFGGGNWPDTQAGCSAKPVPKPGCRSPPWPTLLPGLLPKLLFWVIGRPLPAPNLGSAK
jgi:hypothetical protein